MPHSVVPEAPEALFARHPGNCEAVIRDPDVELTVDPGYPATRDSGMTVIDNSTTTSFGMTVIDNSTTTSFGMTVIDNSRTTNSGMTVIDDSRTTNSGMTEVRVKRP